MKNRFIQIIYISIAIFLLAQLIPNWANGEEPVTPRENKVEKNDNDQDLADEITVKDDLPEQEDSRSGRKIPVGLRLSDKIIIKYRQKDKITPRRSETSNFSGDIDTSGIKESAHEDINNILVLLSEIPVDGGKPTVAPVFLTDQNNIFGTRTNLSFSWVGYKLTLKFTQKKFPWKNTTLQQIFIGSFLYASGTNLGFIKSQFQKEADFFTNYTSQILLIKWKMMEYISSGFGLGSRQYFFIRRDTPLGFIMPQDHVNIFPRLMLTIGDLTEKGIDRLSHGIQFSSWIGYGFRSSWGEWGLPGNMQSGEYARDFLIYSTSLRFGFLFDDHHNFTLRIKYKGGLDNDFLSQPRFGGSIDNAQLDVVHGFTLDYFRVYRFMLMNMSYGFNIINRLRLNLYFDFTHIFSPSHSNAVGFGYGFRIISFFGLPIWISHGIGKKLYPDNSNTFHTFSIMTAAGW